MKLKCVASIFDVYHKVNEISVERIRDKRLEYSTEILLNHSSECIFNYHRTARRFLLNKLFMFPQQYFIADEISDVTSDKPSPSYKQNAYPVYLFNAASKQSFTQLLSYVIIFIVLTGCQ